MNQAWIGRSRSSAKHQSCPRQKTNIVQTPSWQARYRIETYLVKIVEICSGTSGSFVTKDLLNFVLLGLIIGLSASAGSAAQSVTLGWDPSPDPSVVGYYVHFGTASYDYSGLVDAGDATTATVSGLDAGQTYYFAVTAYNQLRIESQPSGEISYKVPAPITVPPPIAGQLRIVQGAASGGPPRLQFLVPPTYQYEVYASEDLRSWKKIYGSISLSTNWIEFTDSRGARLPKCFYRLVLPDKRQAPGMISILRDADSGKGCRLRVAVLAGQQYRIEASADGQSWTTIYHAISTSTEPVELIDPQQGMFQRRLYRLAFE